MNTIESSPVETGITVIQSVSSLNLSVTPKYSLLKTLEIVLRNIDGTFASSQWLVGVLCHEVRYCCYPRSQYTLHIERGSWLTLKYVSLLYKHEAPYKLWAFKHMNHGPAFQRLNAQLRSEVLALQAKGYFGDGAVLHVYLQFLRSIF